MRLSVLIADDEPHARRYLKGLLSKDDEVEAIFECKNGQEVLNFLKNKVPSIIFLDINMPGITGIEVATRIKETESLIIFSTAYDEFALKAFELEAFDYLLKPFDEDRFFNVLDRAKATMEQFQKAKFSEKFVELYEDFNQSITPHLSEFVVKDKGFERRFPVNEVLYIEASTVYAVLHLNKKTVLYRTALAVLEQQLSPDFIRIHRSYIVNTRQVKSIKYLNNSTYRITMANDEVIISSRKYKERINKMWS